MAEPEQNMPTPAIDPETGLPDARDPDIHLQRLLAMEVEKPWFASFVQNVKEFVNPPKLPPLEVTSKPVAVKDIWGFYGDHHKACRRFQSPDSRRSDCAAVHRGQPPGREQEAG